MRAVIGVMENGVVSLPEGTQPGSQPQVVVLIPEEGDEGVDRVPHVLQYAGMLNDLTPEQEAAFDAAIKRPEPPAVPAK